MKINKNQAVYKYLPNTWVNFESENARSYSMKVSKWNHKPITNVFKEKIFGEVEKTIKSFYSRGGDTTEFSRLNIDSINICEPIINSDFTSINGKLNPNIFYCSSCHSVEKINRIKELKNVNCCKNPLKKQLKYLYTCKCGFAEGVDIPFIKDSKINAKDIKFDNRFEQFKFYYKVGKDKKTIEMNKKCPDCGAFLFPKNANDSANYYPFTNKVVNLISKNQENLIKKGDLAKKIIISRYLNLISEKDYLNVEKYPERIDEDEKISLSKTEVEKNAKDLGVDVDTYLRVINKHNISSKGNDIKTTIEKFDQIFYKSNDLSKISNDILEYFTIKSAKYHKTLEDLNKDDILNHNLVKSSMNKIGIERISFSSGIEIVNSTFGYTRRQTVPDLDPKSTKLKLKSFFEQGKYNVFSSVLETEGILFELNKKAICRWLIDNSIIEAEELDLDDAKSISMYLLNHVKIEKITTFSDFDEFENDKDYMITKFVYSLIHSLSHILLKSLGSFSGLDKDSLAEIIYPSIASIFIYSTTVQGISLGSLNGLYDYNLNVVLESFLKSFDSCILDPICTHEQNARCVSCLYLNEVSCNHFNKDLSRIYLKGGKLSSANNKFEVKVGFIKYG
jgi:hypothetical protein